MSDERARSIVPEPCPGDPVVNEETALAEGLTAEEYAKICEHLGRTPLGEAPLFSPRAGGTEIRPVAVSGSVDEECWRLGGGLAR